MKPGIVRWLTGLIASVLLVAAASCLLALLKPWVLPLPVACLAPAPLLVISSLPTGSSPIGSGSR